MRWILLAAVACSAPAKPERERPTGLPRDDRALQLERAERERVERDPRTEREPPAEAAPPAEAVSAFRLTGDSKHVVYGRRLARVPVGGGPTLSIASGLEVAELGNFAVSPDARWVAPRPGEQCFVKPAGNRRAVIHEWHQSGRGTRRELLLVDLAGGPVRRLVPTLDGAGNFETSPDGRFVLFDGPRDAPALSLIRLP